MRAYDDLVRLARICANNAHIASTPEVARALWKMATEYRAKAMAVDSGKPFDIGPAPPDLGE